MKSIYSQILILFLLPIFVVANNGKQKGKYTKEKTYNKEFSVNPDATLKVSNKFGNVDVTSWNENKVKIDVKITVNGNNEDKVKETLDKIKVNFSYTKDLVEAITQMEKKKWGWNSKNKLNIKINYTIKVPISNNVKVNNKYGNISLDNLEGNTNISCDYGKVYLGKLNGGTNQINLDYSSGSNIEYIKQGNINADYSGIVIGGVGNLNLQTDYTDTKIKSAGRVNFNGDYGGITLGKVDVLAADADYTRIKISDLSKSLSVNAGYGSIKVENIKNSMDKITINSDYTNISLKYEANTDFDFDLDLSYAGFNKSDDLNITTSHKKNSSAKYKGYSVKSNSGNMIKIVSDYGNVSLKKH